MTPTKTPLVRIVDKDRSWSDALRVQLTFQNIQCKCYDDAQTFLEVDDLMRPGCIVLDLDTPTLSGLTLLSKLKKDGVVIPIVMTGSDAMIAHAVEAMKLGAADFIGKPVNTKRVVKVVSDIIASEAQDEEVTRFLMAYTTLSKRERQVIEVSSRGLSHEEVAEKLGISIKTAQVHRYNAYRKLGIHNITETFHMMTRTGLLEEEG